MPGAQYKQAKFTDRLCRRWMGSQVPNSKQLAGAYLLILHTVPVPRRQRDLHLVAEAGHLR